MFSHRCYFTFNVNIWFARNQYMGEILCRNRSGHHSKSHQRNLVEENAHTRQGISWADNHILCLNISYCSQCSMHDIYNRVCTRFAFYSNICIYMYIYIQFYTWMRTIIITSTYQCNVFKVDDLSSNNPRQIRCPKHIDGLVQDVTLLLTHWSYVFLALTHRHDADTCTRTMHLHRLCFGSHFIVDLYII